MMRPGAECKGVGGMQKWKDRKRGEGGGQGGSGEGGVICLPGHSEVGVLVNCTRNEAAYIPSTPKHVRKGGWE